MVATTAKPSIRLKTTSEQMPVSTERNRSFAATVKKFFFALSLPTGSFLQVTEHDVVCFSKDRFNLEKIEKINFHCRRLQNNQNSRRNKASSKLHLHAKGKKAG